MKETNPKDIRLIPNKSARSDINHVEHLYMRYLVENPIYLVTQEGGVGGCLEAFFTGCNVCATGCIVAGVISVNSGGKSSERGRLRDTTSQDCSIVAHTTYG